MAKSTNKKQAQVVSENSFVDTFNREWDEKEPDTIYGIYSPHGQSLGVKKVFYSGLPTLDRIVAVKMDSNFYGMPLGKILELFGAEQCGKTTLCKYLCAMFAKQGGLSYFVDFEHKFDSAWFRRIAKVNGIDDEILKNRFRYVDPKNFEHFLNWLVRLMRKIIESKNAAVKEMVELEAKKKKPENYEELKAAYQKIIDVPFLIVVDSIASIYTKGEMEGESVTDQTVAEIANIFNRVLKRIRYYLGYTKALIIFTNQVRDVIEMNPWMAKRGSKIRTPGGNAIKHFSDGRIQMNRVAAIKRTRDKIAYTVGSIHNLRCVKNQMGPPPFQECQLRLLNNRGIFSFQSVVEQLAIAGIIKKTGSLYQLNIKGNIVQIHEADLDEELAEHPEYEKLCHNAYIKYMEKNND